MLGWCYPWTHSKLFMGGDSTTHQHKPQHYHTVSSQTHTSKCTRDRLNSSRLLPSSLQPFKCGRRHIPPRIVAFRPPQSTAHHHLQKQRCEGSAPSPFQLRPRPPSFVSACVCVRRKVSFPLPRVQGVQDPRPPVSRVTQCQALRQASGTRPVLQPAGSWLALQRWLEVTLVIKRLGGPAESWREACIHMR